MSEIEKETRSGRPFVSLPGIASRMGFLLVAPDFAIVDEWAQVSESMLGFFWHVVSLVEERQSKTAIVVADMVVVASESPSGFLVFSLAQASGSVNASS